MGRFSQAGVVLGPVGGRAAALCRFAGLPGATGSAVTVAVVERAVELAERLAGVAEVGELMELWSLGHVWGHPVYDNVTLPELPEPCMVLAGQLQELVEELEPQELREVGSALGIDHLVVVVALEMVEENNSSPLPLRVQSLAEAERDRQSEEDRVGDLADVLLLEAPEHWPAPQRAAVVLVLVWELAALVAQLAQLSVLPATPRRALLWQDPDGEHACTSALVPGTDVWVWARTEVNWYESRPLWHRSGVPAPVRLRWSSGWTGGDGGRLWCQGGHAASVAAARWNAEQVAQALLADPERAVAALTV
ncbi:hypothetical protein [Kitasatospora sp. NPDC004272]